MKTSGNLGPRELIFTLEKEPLAPRLSCLVSSVGPVVNRGHSLLETQTSEPACEIQTRDLPCRLNGVYIQTYITRN